MIEVAEGVDDGHARPFGEAIHGALQEDACHQPIDPAIQIAGDILQRFTNEQRALVGPAIERAAAAVHEWIERGISPAMNRFNGDDEPAKNKESNDPGGRT